MFFFLSDSDDNTVTCQFCDKEVQKERYPLILHARTCTMVARPDKPAYRYVCYKCDYHTQFTGHMSDHIKRHLNVKNYACPYCKFVATTRNSVKSHLIYRHSNVEKLECQFCNYSTKLNSQLKFHVRRKHSDILLLGN
uniref:Zinc finger protein 407 n=2 Tax=Cacopsylla melanoneura TaxID=428564 RepID=A0A8D8SDX3_9HEMI